MRLWTGSVYWFSLSPVGAAPTSLFSAEHQASKAKTIARLDEKHLSFFYLVRLILEVCRQFLNNQVRIQLNDNNKNNGIQ